jgi:hypothetical protein
MWRYCQHHAYRKKTDDVAQIYGPLFKQFRRKGTDSLIIFQMRHLDIKHQKRDRHAEDAVTERLQPARIVSAFVGAFSLVYRQRIVFLPVHAIITPLASSDILL